MRRVFVCVCACRRGFGSSTTKQLVSMPAGLSLGSVLGQATEAIRRDDANYRMDDLESLAS